MSIKKRNIVKSTKSGRLYIETTDFLKQKKVKATIKLLLESDLIKDIEKKRRDEQKVHA
ncbi:conserved hypothetical protein [Tenacibaculum maritimum]|uniref:hypothetical protein n=1 Tax=Tenacibaculum maritimum TaxID=107401 RepID=UPI0012E4EE35|nr:hypothetical protein [Tenacibaculum maritimum]CAA0189886.1 conserved hypothetical protein [Tenacibaculum maritimum]